MVKFELVGNKTMPVAYIGFGNSLVCMSGPNKRTFNGLVISELPGDNVGNTDELKQPLALVFHTRKDVTRFIKNLQQLEEKFNYNI